LFFGGAGVWTQSFALGHQVLAKQAVYCLGFTSKAMLLQSFWRWGSCPGWPQTEIPPISASLVVRIIGMSHQHQGNQHFTKYEQLFLDKLIPCLFFLMILTWQLFIFLALG
jgi:hypothetical protein